MNDSSSVDNSMMQIYNWNYERPLSVDIVNVYSIGNNMNTISLPS
jgi:hypothetical protein